MSLQTPNGQRHIFIGGVHRSGTSILHRLLRAHPEISGFVGTGVPEDEGQHLQSVFPLGHPVGRFSFVAENYLTEASPLVTPENRAKLLAEWSRYWDLSKPVLLEKSPPTIIHSRFLQAMFPISAFIFVVRHPLAAGYATLRMAGERWNLTGIHEVFEHWVLSHQALMHDIRHLQRSVIIRYEDFVNTPETALHALQDFIGVAQAKLAEPVRRETNEKYFLEWEAEIAKDPVMLQRLRLLVPQAQAFGYFLMAPYVRALPNGAREPADAKAAG